MRIFIPLSAAFILVAISMATAAAIQLPAAQPQTPQIRLHRGSFDVQSAPKDGEGLGGYALVQFHGPIAPADRSALEGTGVKIREYLPEFAYLVQGHPEQLQAAAALPQVYGVAPFLVADKLAPGLLHALLDPQHEVGEVYIIGWPDDQGELARDLNDLGIAAKSTQSIEGLLQVAALPSVRWIEPVGRPHLLNDVGRAIMNVNQVWQDLGFYGAGQTVAVVDTGLDTGDPTTISPDFAGRIAATQVLSTDGSWADAHGHGTHVMGAIAGAGVQSGANPAQHQYTTSFAGVAPEANIVLSAFDALSTGDIIGLGSDLYPVLAHGYQHGARIHSNSWGDYTGPASDTEAAFGGYTFWSQRVDQFLWDYPDMATFFAAGNSGTDGAPGVFGFCTGGDGVVDPDSLMAPATAKNVISVGASETVRSTGLGGYPWLLFNLCFATEPISLDTMANNANGMAAFSSRGPTDDGRIKPDLVVPGSNNVSNASHYPGALTLWGTYEGNSHYAYSGGTSMATPLAAGAGALVREWLATQGLANPSGAAVKAMLLNTTHDMAPGQYGPGPKQEIPFSRPNNVAGWGRLNLGFMVSGAPYDIWVDDHTAGLSTGETVVYTHTPERRLEVLSSSQPLRVMLAWTDAPASLSAATQLVNDLDLEVVAPDGTVYMGNGNPSGDRRNNVEGVIIPNPALGSYSVRVKAYNVPIASQPYALVVSGPFLAPPPTTPTPVASLTATTTNTPAVTATPSNTSIPISTPLPSATVGASSTPTSAAASSTPTLAPATATPSVPPATATRTATSSPTKTATRTPTLSPTATKTHTPQPPFTPTVTPTVIFERSTPTPTTVIGPRFSPTPTR